MTEVVYHGTYGGYELTTSIVERYNELAGTKYGTDNIGIYEAAKVINRHDSYLVQAVREYLNKEDTPSVPKIWLEIKKLKGNKYIIDEYDGWETVQEPDDIEWIEVDD
jgi:hypothetical protein